MRMTRWMVPILVRAGVSMAVLSLVACAATAQARLIASAPSPRDGVIAAGKDAGKGGGVGGGAGSGARTAEPVDWSRVVPGPDGTRRALVSVLFDRFERGPDTGSLQQRIDSLDAENRTLRARLDALEALLRDPARKEGAK